MQSKSRSFKVSIGMRLAVLVGIALLSTIVTAGYGMGTGSRLANEIDYAYMAITKPLVAIATAQGDFNAMITAFYDLAQDFNTEEERVKYERIIKEKYESYKASITLYKETMDYYSSNDKWELETVDRLYEELGFLSDQVELIENTIKSEGCDNAILYIRDDFLEYADGVRQNLSDLSRILEEQTSEERRLAHNLQERADVLTVTITTVTAVFLLCIAYIIVRSITVPMNEMADASESISNGILDVEIKYFADDELGVLADSLRRLRTTVTGIITDMKTMAEMQSGGDFEYFIDTSVYRGSYLDMANGINNMTKITVDDVRTIVSYLHSLANGDFDVIIKRFPGKKEEINHSLDEMHQNLLSIYSEINSFVTDAASGVLSRRADVSNYPGGWGGLLSELNNLMDAIVRPIKEANGVMHKLAKGDFGARVLSDYAGEWAVIKETVNTTAEGLASYMSDKLHAERSAHESQLARGRAEAAAETRMKFLANMSHEIRTPMNGVIGLTELALDGDISVKTADYLYKIKNSAEGLLAIINDILDISKIDSGEMSLEIIPFELKSVFKDCETVMTHKSEEKGLNLNFIDETDLKNKIFGDPTKLRQIFLNLVSNSIKFTSKGSVSLTARRVKQENEPDDSITIYFEVADTGIGISKEKAKEIFEPFKQADNSTTRNFGGTGLGLSITKSLIEMMGGKIEVFSVVSKGSKFFFTLTFKLSEEVCDATENNTAYITRPIFKGKALVCEDNSTNMQVASENLERLGFKVTQAKNGQVGLREAVALLKNKKAFDIIFMDIHMPVMDGFTATKKMIEAGVKTPIVAMTANARPSDRRDCLDAGMADYISKPFKPRQLWACLLKYITPIKTIEYERNYKKDEATGDKSAINMKAGIEYCNGNRELYNKFLKEFLVKQPEVKKDLESAVIEGKYNDAAVIAHTAKSVAALIGADRLSKTLLTLEEAFNENHYNNGMMVKYKTELAAALKHIESMDLGEGKTVNSESELNAELALKMLKMMKPYLERGEVMDDAAALEVSKALSPMGEQFNKLMAQLDDFDFDLALETVIEMEGILGEMNE